MKIDVEGTEYKALLGAVNAIKKHKPIIAFEQHCSEFGVQSDETKMIDFLRGLGYEIFWLQSHTSQLPWILRRIRDVYQIFVGVVEERKVVTDSVVPRGMHSMVITIHAVMYPA